MATTVLRTSAPGAGLRFRLRDSHPLACRLAIVIGLLTGGLASALAADTPPAGTEASSAKPRQIYVPQESLDVVFGQQHKGVLLKRAEFQELWNQAEQQRRQIPPGTPGFVLSQAEYQARIAGEQLVIDAVLEFTQFQPGWQGIPLAFRAVAIESARLDDTPAQIGTLPNDGGCLLFSNERGRHTLKLTLSTPLRAAGSDRLAGFHLPPVGSATFQLQIPKGKFLQLNELPLERKKPVAEAATYDFPIGGQTRLTLRITDRQTEQDEQTLVFASTTSSVQVAPQQLTWRAVTEVQVFGNPIDTLEFRVPQALEIISIESSGLERWTFDGEEQGQTRLKLAYRQRSNDVRRVEIRGIATVPSGTQWQVPPLVLGESVAHTTHVVVQYPSTLRVHVAEAVNIRRVTAEDHLESRLPGLDGGRTLSFLAAGQNYSLRLETRPRHRELQASITTRLDLGEHTASLRSLLLIQSRFAPLFDLDLSLPADWTIQRILVQNAPVEWHAIPVEAGLHRIRISFPAPIPANHPVELQLESTWNPMDSWPPGEEPVVVPLPEVQLLQAGVTEGRYLIATETDFDLAVEELAGLSPSHLTDIPAASRGTLRLVYDYQDSRFSGKLRVSRKAARLAAHTFAFHRLDRETLHSHLEARLLIGGGGTTSLQIQLPEEVGTDLRFRVLNSPCHVTSQTAAKPENGLRRWTLQFDQMLRGTVQLGVDLETPRPADTTQIPCPGLKVLNAERQDAYVAIEASPEQLLKLTAINSTGQTLNEIASADLPAPLSYTPVERVIAGYYSPRAEYRVLVQETRLNAGAVPTAICDSAKLASVLGESGELQNQVEFVLRAVGVPSLEIRLPAEGVLWGILCDNLPLEARKDDKQPEVLRVTLPVASSGARDAIRRVQVFYQTTTPASMLGGELLQTFPEIAAVGGSGKVEPIPILDRKWQLHHPSSLIVTRSEGPFESQTPIAVQGFLSGLQSELKLASFTKLVNRSLVVGLFAAVVFLIGFAWRRRGIIAAVLVGFVGLCLIAVSLRPYYAQWSPGGLAIALNEDSDSLDYRARPVVPADGPAATTAPANNMELQDQFHHTQEPRDEAQLDTGHLLADHDRKAGTPAPAEESAPAADPFGAVTSQRDLDRMDRPLSDGKKRQSKQEPALSEKDGVVAVPGIVAQSAAPPVKAPQPNAPAASQPAASQPAPAALLSLGLTLQVPPHSRLAEFRTTSAATSQVPLLLHYRSERTLQGVFILFQILVVWLFWLLRESRRGRGLLLFVCLILPVALAAVVPIEYTPYFDGIFAGGLWGTGLCVLWSIARRIVGAHIPAHAVAYRTTTVLCLMVVTQWGTSRSLSAAEPAAPRTGPPAASAAPKVFLAPQPSATAKSAAAAKAPKAAVTVKPSAAAKPAVPPHGRPALVSEFDQSPLPAILAGETTVVVPYSSPTEPLQADRVFLPWPQFLKLWNQAHPEAPLERPVPSRQGFVAEALYTAELLPAKDKQSPRVAVTGRLVLFSLAEGTTVVPLPLGKVAVSESQLDGKPAPLASGKNAGELAVVLPNPGVHVLDLKFELIAQQQGPAGKFTIPLKPVAAGTLRFTQPGKDLKFRLTGTAAAYRQEQVDSGTVLVVPVAAGGDLTLSWATPASREQQVASTIHVATINNLVVEENGIRQTSRYDISVRQGIVSEVSFDVPTGVLVRKISGPDLAGWESARDGEAHRLRVLFRREVTDQTRLTFDLFVPLSLEEQPQVFDVPQFVPRDITHETGTLTLAASSAVKVDIARVENLNRVDLPAAPKGKQAAAQAPAPAFAFHYSRRPARLELRLSRQVPHVAGTADHAALVTGQKIRLTSKLSVRLAGAPRSELVIDLPAGFLLYDLQSPTIANIDYALQADNDQPPRLFVDLAAPRTGTIELVLDGALPRDPDSADIQFLFPLLRDVAELETRAAVWLEDGLSATLGETEDWRPRDPIQFPAAIRALRPTPIQFALSTRQTEPAAIPLTLEQQTPQFKADALSAIVVRDSQTDYVLSLQWEIANAPARQFTFVTPDWLAGRLDFSGNTGGPRIRQTTSEKIAGQKVRWTLTLDAATRNRYFVTARASLPPAGHQVTAPTIEFEQPAVPGEEARPLKIQRQFVLLVNQSRLQLKLAQGVTLRPISPAELPIKISTELVEQAVGIFQSTDPSSQAKWDVQVLEQVKDSAASINLATHVFVAAADGTWRQQSSYRMSNRGKQFLALELPPNAGILSLTVDSKPARPIQTRRGERDVVLAPLPNRAAGDLSFVVNILYAGRLEDTLPRHFRFRRAKFDLPHARVLSRTDDAEFGIPVARTEWTIYFPEDLDVEPIDNADRTNVTVSAEGAQQLVALLSESLDLAGYALSLPASSTRSRVQSRATHNFSQLQQSLGHYQSSSGAAPAAENAEVELLYDKLQVARQQLQKKQAVAGKEIAAEGKSELQLGVPADANTVEQDLQISNAYVIGKPALDANSDGFSLNGIQLTPSRGARAAGQAGEGLGNRAELRKNTASQAARLNSQPDQAVNSGSQPVDQPPAPAQKPGSGFSDISGLTTLGESNSGQMGAGFKMESGGKGPGGGGIGGGVAEPQAKELLQRNAEVQAWWAPGGLALPAELPLSGKKLTFSKVGGDPKLAVGIRAGQRDNARLGLIWAGLWIGVGVAILLATRRRRKGTQMEAWSWGLVILGLTCLYLLPDSLFAFVGLAMFVCGGLGLMWRYRAPAR